MYLMVMYVAASRFKEAAFWSATKYKALFSYMYGTKYVCNHYET